MTLLAILATAFGTLMSIANIPQAIRIFRRKSAKDISVVTYSIFWISSIVWLFYGIEISNMPIIIAYGVGILSCSLVMLGWLKYR